MWQGILQLLHTLLPLYSDVAQVRKMLTEVLTVRIECSDFRTKNTKGRYSARTLPITD